MELSEEIARNIDLSRIGSRFEKIVIDADSIMEFVKRESVRAELGKIAEQFASAVENGDYSYYLKPKDIVTFLKSISEEIRDEFGIKLTNSDYHKND